ncbi:hypothetical protein L7F22_036953 [Adiantum nelumboides]|nr:hypothetical protein [Adiantum nelumboides]
MVTAGVYLVARSAPIFDESPAAQLVGTIIGAIHAALRLHRRCGQDDLKKVLANSTGQPDRLHVPRRRARARRLRDRHHPPAGPRLLQGRALPVGRFVMHAMNDRIDMRRLRWALEGHAHHLRRLRLRLPRDPRHPALHRLLHQGQDHRVGLRPGRHVRRDPRHLRAARRGLTAFYMTRAFVMTFHGKRRWEDDVHPHESKPVMWAPMALLGVLALGAGFFMYMGSSVQNWLEPRWARLRRPASTPSRRPSSRR